MQICAPGFFITILHCTSSSQKSSDSYCTTRLQEICFVEYFWLLLLSILRYFKKFHTNYLKYLENTLNTIPAFPFLGSINCVYTIYEQCMNLLIDYKSSVNFRNTWEVVSIYNFYEKPFIIFPLSLQTVNPNKSISRL